MLTTRELQDEIIRLKKEKDICILAHAYQSHDIWEVADYVGDSYGLSVQAAKAAQSTVLMCGVRFMAETVKILSPQKRVLLSNSNAGCPMAEQMDVELISGVKKMYPDYTVVAYINTTSELKTICDVCVTSSSAVQIVKNIENKNILFATGNVSQEGYPTAKCIFVKPVENRSDELKDKPLYLVSDTGMESPYFVVTPNVLEALGRVDKTSLGVISLDDRILVPMNNSSIIKITDEYYACNKASSVYEIEEIKSDPIKAQENASVANEIKNSITKVRGTDKDFVCNVFYSKNDI